MLLKNFYLTRSRKLTKKKGLCTFARGLFASSLSGSQGRARVAGFKMKLPKVPARFFRAGTGDLVKAGENCSAAVLEVVSCHKNHYKKLVLL